MYQGVVVNCEKVPFDVTLGVAGYLLNLCEALADTNRIIFAVNDVESAGRSPASSRIEKMGGELVELSAAVKNRRFMAPGWVELLPHHFQEGSLCSKSIIICHDLHIYDVPWKYKNVEKVQLDFRKNLCSADVVFTEFPRTYYDLEEIAGITLMNLYLTETPLLLDTRRDSTASSSRRPEVPFLLYPAQLQKHKGHEALLRAMAELKSTGIDVVIKCTGSDFNATTTEELKSLASELGVEENVIFTGRISDKELVEMYHECTGVIIPSMAEGGAYVAFEAIAARKPVAVNAIKSAQLHLKMIDGNVIWFDSKEISDTASAIVQLIESDQNEWDALNSTARDRISRMTWQRVAGQFQGVISWLAGDRERPTMQVRHDYWEISCT